MRKILFTGIVLILFCSCNFHEDVHIQKYYGEALGTTYAIQYFSEKDFSFEKSLDSIFDKVNSSMSTYMINSDISRINRGDTTVKVDQNFVNVFNASEKIFRETNGFFDPTVGVLVNAYGFGPAKPLKEINDEKLDSLKMLVGFDKITLQEDRTVKKKYPSAYLDFNAIAKGYTIDVIAEYLESQNIQNYLIELGGELRAKGKNLESENIWIVGIDHPNQNTDRRRLEAKVKLVNAAMASSGNYRKFRQDSLTGQKYVHTINPMSGKAERSNLLSASVITENCMLADGYATAFMALGLERTKEVLETLDGVEVYIMYSAEDGNIGIFSTPGFEKNLVE